MLIKEVEIFSRGPECASDHTAAAAKYMSTGCQTDRTSMLLSSLAISSLGTEKPVKSSSATNRTFCHDDSAAQVRASVMLTNRSPNTTMAPICATSARHQ